MVKRLEIGANCPLAQPETATELKFLSTESAHESVNSFLIALMGFSALVDVWSPRSTGPANPWGDGHYATFQGLLCDVELRIKPHIVVQSAVLNYIPFEIIFEQFAIVRPPEPNQPIRLGSIGPFIFGLSNMLIVSFFERHKDHLRIKYGSIDHWPAVWQFARMVRNAMSHGNTVTVTDGKSASWKGLTYSEAENGRTVINSDLFPADLIVLLRELEDAL